MKTIKNFFLIIAIAGAVSLSSQTPYDLRQSVDEKIIHINDKTFDSIIADGVVLVDFWATWCRPCIKQAPILEELAEDFKGKVSFAKLDIDKNRATARRFVIRSIPTMIIFKDGKAVERISGLTKKNELKKRIKKHL